jgi:hypothetical protein
MPNRFVFADEAGCFTFKKCEGASRFFALCTICVDHCKFADDLLQIRREIALTIDSDCDKLHATSDLQTTRDRVFAVLEAHDFRIDATLLEKSKAQPHTRCNDPTFYQYAWYYHFKHVGPRILNGADKLLITAAALGSKKTKAAFKLAVHNTMEQISSRDKWEVFPSTKTSRPYRKNSQNRVGVHQADLRTKCRTFDQSLKLRCCSSYAWEAKGAGST